MKKYHWNFCALNHGGGGWSFHPSARLPFIDHFLLIEAFVPTSMAGGYGQKVRVQLGTLDGIL